MTRISLKVKPGAKVQRIEKLSADEFRLWIRSPAREGRANEEVIKLLSEYLDIAKSRITIIRGQKSRDKIIDIQ